jgi:hypothetical protein
VRRITQIKDKIDSLKGDVQPNSQHRKMKKSSTLEDKILKFAKNTPYLSRYAISILPSR